MSEIADAIRGLAVVMAIGNLSIVIALFLYRK